MIQDAIMANESSADDTIADEAAVSDVVTGEGSSLPAEELEALGKELIAAIKTVYDPEIPVDIFELGLIYKVDVADNKDICVTPCV